MKQEQMTIAALYDLKASLAGSRLAAFTYPWEVLPHIGDIIRELILLLPQDEFYEYQPEVWVAKSAAIYPQAVFTGPCIIGRNTEVRPGAFIRGKALVGDHCVVGNSSELKNVILFDHVQVPHYNYVGDSILGTYSHLGAGAITSNVKGDRLPVHVHAPETDLDTGLKKFGAMLGDHVEVGCNTVMNPGTVIGRGSRIYPLTFVRGFVPAGHILKQDGCLVACRPVPPAAGGKELNQ